MATQLIKGNTAVVVGALYAGCDCYFGYPITPASEILQEASKLFPQLGRKFVQAESEEAAINMTYGAAAAGHRALTASSGPGISLKQEGVSYMAGSELPCVIADIMRAGPGLGNIGPEQGDYNQVVKGGGHGNYHAIVVAPNSIQEMCDLTMLAFDLAFKYRTPAYLLADGVLGQMIEPLKFPDQALQPTVDPAWSVSGNEDTMNNLSTSIFLDFDQQEDFNNRLQTKYRTIREAECRHETYLTEDADIVLVAYGICSRIAKSAVDQARSEGIKAGLFRPITLFPWPAPALRQIAAARPITLLSIELSNGQMRDDIKLAIDCMRPVHLVSRLGGNLVNMDQVLTSIRGLA